ncbi:hypothetical protein Bca4012_056236 [Brassica carinata]|uniref:Uncharacterized protein n=1 Tax=Brassica carinata TaxID=52824 RepID=A0A8X7W1Q0_BRACI|nr:hypothetical protein Bca52824_013941 [Brassica carinata]
MTETCCYYVLEETRSIDNNNTITTGCRHPMGFHPVSWLIVGATNSAYYSIEKFSNSSFSDGGPHHGAAVNVKFDLIPLSCFVLLLFV